MYYYVHHDSCCVWTSDSPNKATGLVDEISQKMCQDLIRLESYNFSHEEAAKYAGIGARDTPGEIQQIMFLVGHEMAKQGWICCTGAADGADKAFANGADKFGGSIELSLPWATYERAWYASLGNYSIKVVDKLANPEAFQSVATFHPAPHKLSQAVTKLHARNYMIIENKRMVICWTPGGKVVGGTGQAIRIAESLNIPVYNYGNPATLEAQIKSLQRLGYTT